MINAMMMIDDESEPLSLFPLERSVLNQCFWDIYVIYNLHLLIIKRKPISKVPN